MKTKHCTIYSINGKRPERPTKIEFPLNTIVGIRILIPGNMIEICRNSKLQHGLENIVLAPITDCQDSFCFKNKTIDSVTGFYEWVGDADSLSVETEDFSKEVKVGDIYLNLHDNLYYLVIGINSDGVGRYAYLLCQTGQVSHVILSSIWTLPEHYSFADVFTGKMEFYFGKEKDRVEAQNLPVKDEDNEEITTLSNRLDDDFDI